MEKYKANQQTRERIPIVARKRVMGAGWDKIASEFGYATGDTCRISLQTNHPELWAAAYNEAREKFLDDMESEASLVMRGLLREDDLHLRQSAAHSLLNHSRQCRAAKVHITGKLEHSVKTVADLVPSNGTATPDIIEKVKNVSSDT